jgi:hypothetical protein
MTAVEDELPPSDTESLGDEVPTPVTQQEPTQTQPDSEGETVFDPSEAEEDSNSYSSNPRQPTTVMLTVKIVGVTYKKRESKKSLSKTSKTKYDPQISISNTPTPYTGTIASTCLEAEGSARCGLRWSNTPTK